MYILILFALGIGLNLSAETLETKKSKRVTECSDKPAKVDAKLPGLMVIGDSISVGYFPTVKKRIKGYDVVHNPCGAEHTKTGLANIEEWLAPRTQWDLVIFNFGLWDLATVYEISVPQYRKNLKQIAEVIKSKSKKALFITTTYVPYGVENRPENIEQKYNEAAKEVMADAGIEVYDLHADSVAIKNHLLPAEIHFNKKGYEILGEKVSSAILNSLPKKN